jgi:hypothetical protein
MRAVVFDNEAVQALVDAHHRKHRTVLAHLEAVLTRRRQGASVTALVPTSVRAEAGWDRTASAVAAVNRFRIADVPLDSRHADTAAEIVREETDIGVVDAHVGATVRHHPAGDVVVLTCDPADMRRVTRPRTVTVVHI